MFLSDGEVAMCELRCVLHVRRSVYFAILNMREVTRDAGCDEGIVVDVDGEI
jgi:hypothetical protein